MRLTHSDHLGQRLPAIKQYSRSSPQRHIVDFDFYVIRLRLFWWGVSRVESVVEDNRVWGLEVTVDAIWYRHEWDAILPKYLMGWGGCISIRSLGQEAKHTGLSLASA